MNDGSDVQPEPQNYDYDLDDALTAVVGVRAHIPADAFTAEALGTERAGHGVLFRDDGLILTIGYLVAEADTVWLTLGDGQAVPGHVLAYDHETGFGVIQALARLDLPVLPIGRSSSLRIGDPVVVAGSGGRQQAIAARITARREFAGYWEYLLDDAIFTSPVHPSWGGTALIGPAGKLLGIGSLLIQTATEDDGREEDDGHEEEDESESAGGDQNMIVPIDLLKPILDDLLTVGRPQHPARPWLGLYATEIGSRVVIADLASRGPASRSDLHAGDIVLGVGGQEVRSLTSFFRRVWSLGEAGVEVPLRIHRDGQTLEVNVGSADRSDYLKSPVAH